MASSRSEVRQMLYRSLWYIMDLYEHRLENHDEAQQTFQFIIPHIPPGDPTDAGGFLGVLMTVLEVTGTGSS